MTGRSVAGPGVAGPVTVQFQSPSVVQFSPEPSRAKLRSRSPLTPAGLNWTRVLFIGTVIAPFFLTALASAQQSVRTAEQNRRSDSLAALLATYQLDGETNPAAAEAIAAETPPTDAPISDARRAAEEAAQAIRDSKLRGMGDDDDAVDGFTDSGLLETDDQAQDGSTSIADIASDDLPNDQMLSVADVIASVYRSYPEIAAARQQLTVAGGDLLAAYGAYDTKFQAYSLNEPTGFYENFRQGLGLARQTWWGGYLSAGYRIGRGTFQPWYKERQTDDAGELKLAWNQPLLQGRAIDPQRVAVFQASLDQQSAGPIIQASILTISREAALVYWEWVTAGAVLEAQRELLRLTEVRNQQFEDLLAADAAAEIDLLLNQQLLAERRAKVFETEQKFQEKALKLGLYLRDAQGAPMPPNADWLPNRFPVIEMPPMRTLQEDVAAAWARRPEPQLLQLDLQKIQWDRRLACNELLPRLDLISEISQDIGEPASKSDDKDEFLLIFGIQSEVPIQRRKARGKIQKATGKIAQTNQKLRLVRDKIANELYTAYNQLQLSEQAIRQYEISLRTAFRTLEGYRFAFEKGSLDLLSLNLLETKLNEVEIKLIESQQMYFRALSELQAAMGLDPLEQAMLVAGLPASEMIGPGNMPVDDIDADEIEALEKEWELRGRGIGEMPDPNATDDDELDVNDE